MTQPQKIVIIGNGMVGHHLVEQLVQQQELASNSQITVFAAEPRLAYDRVHLSEFFAGRGAADLALTDESTYHNWGVESRTHARVIKIDRQAQQVVTAAGDLFAYDKLVLATGSYPFVPAIPGNDQPHCLVYRTIEDLHAIQASAATSKVGVVIGGGLLGLEAANAIKQLGLETHVVEFAPRLMGVQLDACGGRLLRDKIEELGVQVHTSKATQVIEQGEQCRYRLRFTDGSVLETDLVLFSAGIRPHDLLARESALEVGERGGICVNDHCQTSDPNIYAVGECALWNNFIFGLVAPGYQMAKTVAAHLNQQQSPFTGADMSTKLKLMGVDVGSIGDAHAKTSGALIYSYLDQTEGTYKKLVISADNKTLLGAVLVGDTQEYDSLLQYMLNGIELPHYPESLILPMATKKQALSAADLPDDATLCGCHNVTKKTILQAIDNGATDVGMLAQATKASTGCGGCAAMLQSFFDQPDGSHPPALQPLAIACSFEPA